MAVNDPMLDPTFKYSINRFPGDGVTNVWNLNFAGGYLRREHVKAYTEDAVGNTVERTIEFLSDNQVRVEPAVALGLTLVVYRDTPKDSPLANFTDGSVVNEKNLDLVTEQSIFGVAEMVDRFVEIAEGNDQAITQSAAALLASEQASADAEAASLASASAVAVANDVSTQFGSLVDTVNDIVGEDLSMIPRLNVPQTWSARQQFSELAVQTGGVGIEVTPLGTYRINTGSGWGTYRAFNVWEDLIGKPAAFTPEAHAHPWGQITGKPDNFPPAAHSHTWASITDKPTTYLPTAHRHDWADMDNKPNLAVNGLAASFSSLESEGTRVPRIQVVTAPPTSGGSNGDLWFVVAS